MGNYVDATVIVCLTFLTAFLPYMEDIWASLLIIDTQHLTVNEMNIFFLVAAVSSILTLGFFMLFKFSSRQLFCFALAWILCLIVQQNVTALLKTSHLSYTQTMLLWTVAAVCTTQVVSLEYYYLVELLPKMIAPSKLSYWSSLRWSLYMVGCLVASLCGPYLFDYLEYFVLVVSAFSFLLFFVLVVRRDSFINPKIVIN